MKLCILGGILLLLATAGCSQSTLVFQGTFADDSLTAHGLYNPERGFRLETAVEVSTEKTRAAEQLKLLAAKYDSDSVSLAQSYFYLGDALGRDLSAEDFAVMQAYFDSLRALGMKSVLRFAYERDFMGRAAKGPTLEQALTHLDQLEPFLKKNQDLILVVQAGVIGAWGEWHSSVHGLESSREAKTAILEKLLAIVPAARQVQVRIPEYKNLLADRPELYERVSFHDDFIVIEPDRWDGDMHEGTANFDQMVRESPYLIVDGELPWGFWSVGNDPDSPGAGWLIDGSKTARRLSLQHYTSLSVIHNYKERHSAEKTDSAPEYSMIHWKRTSIDPAYLRENRMPFSENYFRNSDGSPAQRSEFEYIRDHLGYRLELQELRYNPTMKRGSSYPLRLSLVNRGFATLFNEHDILFVIVDRTGNVIEFPTDANCRDWQPHRPDDPDRSAWTHHVNGLLKIPSELPPGTYKLGFWIADSSPRLKRDSRYSVRCANSGLEWLIAQNGEYGINVLAEINIK